MFENLTAEHAENTQRAAEPVIIEFLCGSLRNTLRNSAVKDGIIC